MTKIAAAIAFLIMNGYVYWYLGSAEVIPERQTFAAFPDTVDDWSCTRRETIDDKTLDNLMVTDYLSCDFAKTDRSASTHLYVGYHERQTRDRESGKATVP